MDKSRQQFEATAVKRGLSIEKKKDSWGQEKYKYDMIQIMWEGWQASRESLEVELPERPYYEPFTYEAGVDDGIEMCKQILISNGVKMKNE
ncbi:hypothetical protein [Providencia alcalifaciens]|uniref:hypothetical protein n=1 Tax=Providencia alcalifaciens TaxID=126385 RepID=UPI000D357AF7|nr:hypothetical protein [Providencia alcalifaciens]